MNNRLRSENTKKNRIKLKITDLVLAIKWSIDFKKRILCLVPLILKTYGLHSTLYVQWFSLTMS